MFTAWVAIVGLMVSTLKIMQGIWRMADRLFWHQLSIYPGPFWAILSDWYAAYHGWRGDLHIKILQAHETYGDVVRFGPNRLIFNTIGGLQDIYLSDTVKKSKAYLALLSGSNGWNVHNSINKETNRRKRAFIRQSITKQSLSRFEPALIDKIAIFIELLGSDSQNTGCWTMPINIAPYCRYLIFDIMSEFAFGRNFDLQTRPEHRYMVDGITTLHKFNSAYVQSLDLVKYHMEKIFSPQGLWYGWKFLQIARKLAESRNLPNTTMNPGVFWQMSNFQETSNANKFSMDELWAESKFLMVTGGWSPASALASLLFYLSRYPSCHRRVTAEVRSIFDKASEIHSGSQMTSCHYLRACILESLRMSPPGGAVLWREVERNAMMIDGHAVPPGCDVGTGMYSIHHNENYFPDSFTFKPERWLDDDQRVCQNLDQGHRAFTAFSIGPRSCLGRSLVMMELTDIAALLLWHLDFRLPAGPEAQIGAGTEGLRGRHRIDEFQQRDHIFSFFDGPCLEFRQRHFDISIK